MTQPPTWRLPHSSDSVIYSDIACVTSLRIIFIIIINNIVQYGIVFLIQHVQDPTKLNNVLNGVLTLNQIFYLRYLFIYCDCTRTTENRK